MGFRSDAQGISYFFDADGALTGVHTFDDARPRCSGETHVSEKYGTSCRATGVAMDLCEENCPALPLSDHCTSDDASRCPASIADAPLVCGRGEETVRQDNDCGGENVRIGGGFGSTTYSFDDAGAFIGLQLSSDVTTYCDDTSFVQVYGTVCAATGEPQSLCTDGACEELELTELCEDRECPDGPDGVWLSCGHDFVSERWTTHCGGTAVSSSFGNETTIYFFDGEEKLVGAQLVDDEEDTCTDAGRRVVKAYGATCTMAGEPVDRCRDVCPVLGLSAWCDEHACPADAAEAQSCEASAVLREVWVNDCGGVNVSDQVGNYVGESFSFDQDGKLVGVQRYSDVVAFCDEQSFRQNYGDVCNDVGEPTLICGPAAP